MEAAMLRHLDKLNIIELTREEFDFVHVARAT